MSEPKTWIILPVYNKLEFTEPLIEQLHEERSAWECVVVIDNGSTDGTAEWLDSIHLDGFVVLHEPEMNLHQMWNLGWRRAVEAHPKEPVNVFFLNNDIRFESLQPIQTLAETLRWNADCVGVSPCPLWLRPTDQPTLSPSLGLVGHCFALRGEMAEEGLGYFNESLSYFYGDLDLWLRIQKTGKLVGIRTDVLCKHHGSATLNDTGQPRFMSWNQARETDRDRFRLLHPDYLGADA